MHHLALVTTFFLAGRLILRFSTATGELLVPDILGSSFSLISRLEAIALLVGFPLSSTVFGTSKSPAWVAL